MNNAIAQNNAFKHEECVPRPWIVEQVSSFKTPPTHGQMVTLEFMQRMEETGYGGLICSELGSGKTYTVLAHLALEKRKHLASAEAHLPTPLTLIFAPAAVIHTWANQARLHLNDQELNVFVYHGPDRRNQNSLLDNADVVVMSYTTAVIEYEYVVSTFMHHLQVEEMFRPIFQLFTDRQRIILDEAHCVRNTKSKTFKAIEGFVSGRPAMFNGFFGLHRINKVWCLTGTPVWNSVGDLRALFQVMHNVEGLIQPSHRYRWPFDYFYRRENDRIYQRYIHEDNLITFLVEKMIPVTIRRTKAELDLPDRQETVVRVPLNEIEQLLYDAMYTQSRDKILRLMDLQQQLREAKLTNALAQQVNSSFFETILRLRQLCVHPQLVLDKYKNLPPNASAAANENVLAQHIVQRILDEMALDVEQNRQCSICLGEEPNQCLMPCGHRFCLDCIQGWRAVSNSCPLCRSFIENIVSTQVALDRAAAASAAASAASAPPSKPSKAELEAQNKWPLVGSKFQWVLQDMRSRPADVKFIIFSEWTDALDLMQQYLSETPDFHDTLRIDGKKTLKRRAQVEVTFTEQENAHRVLLVSLFAGGVGLNLQRASVVYFLEPFWTAARTDQASDRSHRLGQTRNVSIVHLLATDTVEERVFQVQQKKRDLGAQLFSEVNNINFVFEIDQVEEVEEVEEVNE